MSNASASGLGPALLASRSTVRGSASTAQSLWLRLWARLVGRDCAPAITRRPVPVAEPAPRIAQRPQPRAPERQVPTSHPPAPVAVRSVPVPVAALTRLLDRDSTSRVRLKHLALVESACLASLPDPFSRLPPRVLEIAMRQLDPVLRDNPPLRVLRLQLERHLHSHRARIAALLAAEDCKWLPQGPSAQLGVGPTPDSMIGGPWGVTDFLETVPIDRGTLQTGYAVGQ